MNRMLIALPLAALVAACGSNGGGAGGSSGDIRIVGSSTVYPFTKAVAEEFMRANRRRHRHGRIDRHGRGHEIVLRRRRQPVPDIEDASRAIKKSEYDACVKNGVKTIIEVPIGIDGLTIIE